MDIIDRLKSSHSLLGDPLHRKAWEEIERLRQQNAELEEQNATLGQMVMNLVGKEVAHVKIHKPKATGGES